MPTIVGRAVVTTVPSRADRAVARIRARMMRGLFMAIERVCCGGGPGGGAGMCAIPLSGALVAVSVVRVLKMLPGAEYGCGIYDGAKESPKRLSLDYHIKDWIVAIG